MTNIKQVVALIVSLLSAVAYSADFNVRDFGAKGNGTAKDTAAIQSAIDTATAKGGGRGALGVCRGVLQGGVLGGRGIAAQDRDADDRTKGAFVCYNTSHFKEVSYRWTAT